MKNLLQIFYCFMFFSLIGFADTDVYDAFRLSRELDTALATRSSHEKCAIYTNILARVPSNTLVTTEYDGADALFETLAGISWAYLDIGDNNYIKKGLEYGLRARDYGYKSGVSATNPEKFADHLHIIALYYEYAPISDKEKRALYQEEAWDHWPHYTLAMQDVWYRKCALVHYKPEKAAPMSQTLVENAPFSSMYYYGNGGWYYILLEQYRDAFRIWQKGLRDSEITDPYNLITVNLMNYIEYATMEELDEIQRLMRVNAARKPASIYSVDTAVRWMNKAEDPHLLFEKTLRTAEENGDTDTVTNMLHEAIAKYRRPLYAEKLGDTNTLVKLYCDRTKQEIWWWMIKPYSLLPKIQALIDSGDCTEETKEYFYFTLLKLRERKPEAEIIDEYLIRNRNLGE